METPEVAVGEGLFLGSQAGRRGPLKGSEGRTVLPTDFEGKRGKEDTATRSRKRE